MRRRSQPLVRRSRAAVALSLTVAACSLLAPDRDELTGASDTAGSAGSIAGSAGRGGSTSMGATGGRGGIDAAAGSDPGGAGGGQSGTNSGTSGSSGSGARGGSSGGSDGMGGSSGSNGASGLSGSNGASGLSGSNGASGSSGSNGANGSNGASGTGGSVGRGGSAGTSGVGGTGGIAGNAGTGGIVGNPERECTATAQCRLYENCCTCTGLTTFEPDLPPSSCSATCSMKECTRTSVTNPQCLLGQCTAGLDCTILLVTCSDARPTCPSGTVVSRVGGCWGPCVDPSDCASVASCSACLPGQLCVAYHEAATFARYRCLPMPSQCAANRRCSCLKNYACPQPSYACSDTSTGVTCNCSLC
jgi:hypothetical protein